MGEGALPSCLFLKNLALPNSLTLHPKFDQKDENLLKVLTRQSISQLLTKIGLKIIIFPKLATSYW